MISSTTHTVCAIVQSTSCVHSTVDVPVQGVGDVTVTQNVFPVMNHDVARHEVMMS